jgi:hypothetical protein
MHPPRDRAQYLLGLPTVSAQVSASGRAAAPGPQHSTVEVLKTALCGRGAREIRA